jgi:hypothetical protein
VLAAGVGALDGFCRAGDTCNAAEGVALLQISSSGSARLATVAEEEEDGIRLFCYAFTATPHETVLSPFTKQLSAACDGWAVFSWRDDPSLGVVKAYTQVQERRALASHQQEMMQGAWRHMNGTGIMNRYDWFLKLDPDTFVVPSRLKAAISRYPKGFGKLLTQGIDDTDGNFVGMSQDLLVKTAEAYARHPDCFRNKHFGEISGHFLLLELPHCPQIPKVEMLADSDGDALVASFENCGELLDKKRRAAYVGSPKQRLCSKFDNTLLSCFEYGSSKNCKKDDVLKGVCGRSLSAGTCVSSLFAALHPVKKLHDFLSLTESFS